MLVQCFDFCFLWFQTAKTMAGLDEMLSLFSLSEVEDGGAKVTRQEETRIHRLARKFLTKRVLNVDVVARTFKPLWKPIGELKIRDVGENILMFEFEDNLDLERVLEFEPWSYDKSLVIFQRVVDVDSVSCLEFSHTTFWLQIHNVLECLLMQATRESISKTLGMVVQEAGLEDDGAGGEFLRVRTMLDISLPLPRCCKLWSEGKLAGSTRIKYERLPNFCYWCGHVNHSERECEIWLRGKGQLSREEQ